ncbi:MAG: hypothetical protein KA479_14150, partial [Saprospiraceae bacterium]|nr:hypothetical protein [Saprospiraceae bacterium]
MKILVSKFGFIDFAKILFCLVFMSSGDTMSAQAVSINTDNSTPDPSAILDVKSTDKGMLIPRLTTVQRTGIASPAIGLLVFDTNTESFWYRDSTTWTNLLSPTSGWSVSGNNAGPNDFMGTINNQSLLFKANNQQAGKIEIVSQNAFWGYRSGESVTSGYANTAIGWQALRSNTSGVNNTADGQEALFTNTMGSSNTATGQGALYANLTGNFNTAQGVGALGSNSAGSNNTAIGMQALFDNHGSLNSSLGKNSLTYNTTGNNNTAMGVDALFSNRAGSNATAVG